jgi:hypothetical protein
MTKKFLIAFSDQGVRKAKRKEFLIPDLNQFSDNFIGIETSKPCQYGLVVYTGVELTTNIVIEKLIQNKVIQQTNIEIENILFDYLQFIKSCKISDVLEIKYDSGQFTYSVTGLRMNLGISKIP